MLVPDHADWHKTKSLQWLTFSVHNTAISSTADVQVGFRNGIPDSEVGNVAERPLPAE